MPPAARRAPALTRRRTVAWLGCGALAPALSACGEPEAALNVGTVLAPGVEFLFLAREKGWLPESQVRLVELLSAADNLRALGDGKLDAAALSLDEAVIARGEGVDLRVVAVMNVSAGADALMVRPEITALGQLRGRRVAVEDTASSLAMLEAILGAAGLAAEDVLKVSYVAERGPSMFQAGQIDAAVSAQPWVTQFEREGARRLFDSRRIPNRIAEVLVVRAQGLADRPAAVKTLVAAHFQAQALWRAQPAAARAVMAQRLQFEPDQLEHAFEGLDLPDANRNRELLRPASLLSATVRQVQLSLLQRKVLREVTAADGLLDSRFLPA